MHCLGSGTRVKKILMVGVQVPGAVGCDPTFLAPWDAAPSAP